MKTKIIFCLVAFFIFLVSLNACQNANEIQQARYFVNGKNIYEKHCQNCHGSKGEGLGELYPSLRESLYIAENTQKLPCDIRFGLNSMPGNRELTPIEITYLINYIGNYFDNSIGFYSQSQTVENLKNCN